MNLRPTHAVRAGGIPAKHKPVPHFRIPAHMNTAATFHLLGQLTRRDLLQKHQGSMFGAIWILLTPLLMLSVFTLVFHGVFGTRWPGTQTQSPIEFALFVFAGLMLFQFVADVITKAPSLVVSQPNYVTKIVFPLWLLPLSSTLSSLFQLLVSTLLLMALLVFTHGCSWYWLWQPFILLPLVAMVTGFAWGLAALGVYARDTGPVISMLTTLLMFLSPIFFPVASVPEAWRTLFMLNPLAIFIEQTRSVLLLNTAPEIGALIMMYLIGAITVSLGIWIFRKLQLGFADVI